MTKLIISAGIMRKAKRGFTLIELITVISIMALLMALGIPAFNMIRGARDLAQSATEIAGTLEAARAYAMANNTYVFVGITEVNLSNGVSDTDQSAGIGRLVVAIVASKDGSNNCDANNRWLDDASNLEAVSRLKVFGKIHMGDFSGLSATSGPMSSLVDIFQGGGVSLGANNAGSGELFAWPLRGTAQYAFDKVIRFDPRGSALLQQNTMSGGSVQWMEIDLQECRGSTLPPAVSDISTGNIAVIQLDGVTGAVRIYRP